MPTSASGIAKKTFLIEECYNIEKMMGNFADYFDYKLFMYDYSIGANGNVFRRIRLLTLSSPQGLSEREGSVCVDIDTKKER